MSVDRTSHSHALGIVGAAGNIGSILTRGLKEKYRLVLIDRVKVPGEETRIIDIGRPDGLAEALQGVDTVVHLAGIHKGGPSFPAVVQENILAGFNVFEAARQAGVEKVIFASTNHVQNGDYAGPTRDVSGVDLNFLARDRRVRLGDLPNPGSHYGLSKLCLEHLGRYYALFLGSYAFAAIRIGWVAPGDPGRAPTEKIFRSQRSEALHRALYCSQRDCLEIFTRVIEDRRQFGLFYAVSDNRPAVFDFEETASALGYEPKDNSTEYFAQIIQ